MSTAAKGRDGETEAEAFLEERGYRILARNYRIRAGEIDRVAWDGDVLCFVEVRTRRAGTRGDPRETIGPAKRRRLIRAAESFLAGRFPGRPPRCRFDVVVGLGAPGGGLAFTLIQGAFDTTP